MRQLEIHLGAKAELCKAQHDYRKRDTRLARDFTDEYLDRVRFIIRFPEAGQRIPKHTNILVQRYLMDKRFPFKLITATRGDRMAIIAVAHHSQAPDYWEDRLDEVDEEVGKTKKKTSRTKKRKTK